MCGLAFLCAALPGHAQMRGVGGHAFDGAHPGPFHGGIVGGRGFISRPFRRQKFFPRPFFPLGVAVPLWWDEPEVVEAPPPQPIVVVVDRENKTDERPERAAAPLIIEREGDRYVRRAANYVAPASPRPPEQSNAPVPPVIVLRNGDRIELTDYAITSDSLYDLRGGRARKIELFDIDLPATKKANEERGSEFALPASFKLE